MLRELAAEIAEVPEVTDYQAYAGLGRADQLQRPGAPVLPAHAAARSGDLQVNLVDKHARATARATRSRRRCARRSRRIGAPSAPTSSRRSAAGPPVLSPIVAEIYGPDYEASMRVAKQLREVFDSTPDIVASTTRVEDARPAAACVRVDQRKAALSA